MPRNTSVFNNPITTSLHPDTIKAQQALSEKFGIPTFNTKGGISTVPSIQSGGFSDINVGLGGYTNINSLAEAALRVQLEREQRMREAGKGTTQNSQGQTVPSTSNSDPIIVADPRNPTRTSTGEATHSSIGTKDITQTIKDNIMPIGIGLIVLMMLMGGKRR